MHLAMKGRRKLFDVSRSFWEGVHERMSAQAHTDSNRTRHTTQYLRVTALSGHVQGHRSVCSALVRVGAFTQNGKNTNGTEPAQRWSGNDRKNV